MNPEDVLTLVKAGYSKDEISQMYGHTDPAPDGADEPEPAPAPEPEEEQPQDPAPEPDRLDRLEAAIDKLTGAIQRGNIGNRGIDTIPTMTAEEALGSLITKKK